MATLKVKVRGRVTVEVTGSDDETITFGSIPVELAFESDEVVEAFAEGRIRPKGEDSALVVVRPVYREVGLTLPIDAVWRLMKGEVMRGVQA